MSRDINFRIIIDDAGAPAAAGRVEKGLQGIGNAAAASSRQTAAAMRSLPAQFTDVATQLAGGQNPLLILLQQGGQIRDQFGSLGAALRGIGSFITPATMGVAGVAALGAALLAAERDAARLRDTLVLTNNAAGLTAGRLDEAAARIAAGSRQTSGAARDIVLALAREGTVSAKLLDTMATSVAMVADASGLAADEVAKDFAGMTRDVAAWAADHNRQFNFITADQYLYIKRLQDMGRAEEAAMFINKQLQQQLGTQQQQLGYLERAWDATAKAASAAWRAILGWGAQQSLEKRLADVTEKVRIAEQNLAGARLRNSGKRPGTALAELQALKDEQLSLIRQIDREQANADAKSERAADNRAKIDTLRQRQAGKAEDEAAKSLRQRQALLTDLVDANAQANLQLIADDQQRGLAQIELERSVLQRRIDAAIAAGPERAAAEALADATAAAQRQRVQDLADERLRRQREAQAEADAKRQQQQSLLTDLVDANAQANLQLIADDQQRALAQIELERSVLQRRIDAVIASGPERAAAEALANATADAARQGVARRFANDAAGNMRNEVRDALSNAFRDAGGRPLQAFGDAIGNIVFQRLTTAAADALVNAVFGTGKAGDAGGLLGSIFGGGGLLGSLFGGQRATGGTVRAGRLYEVNEAAGPGELLRTRSGRTYLMPRQDGAVMPASAQSAGGGVVIQLNNTFTANVTDRAALASWGERLRQQIVADVETRRARDLTGRRS